MRAVILSGGLATSLGDKSGIFPKPVFEVDGRPIIWRILNICSQNGINEVSTRQGVEAFPIVVCAIRSMHAITDKHSRNFWLPYGIPGENR